MSHLRTSLVVALLLTASGLAIPRQGRGQVAAASPLEPLTTDSTAWQRVITHVVDMLSPQIVRAAADPAYQPWELHLPADEPQRLLLETQLRTILRARPATAADSVLYSLHLGPLRIDGDTARVHMQMTVTRRCPGIGGWGNTLEILVPRGQGHMWGVARAGIVAHGSRAGCLSPPR